MGDFLDEGMKDRQWVIFMGRVYKTEVNNKLRLISTFNIQITVLRLDFTNSGLQMNLRLELKFFRLSQKIYRLGPFFANTTISN